MIAIKRKDNQVLLEFHSGLRVERPVYPFVWNTSDENNAELLKEHLHKQLYEAIQKARKEAYEKGYKDGRGKRTRESWFWGGLE